LPRRRGGGRETRQLQMGERRETNLETWLPKIRRSARGKGAKFSLTRRNGQGKKAGTGGGEKNRVTKLEKPMKSRERGKRQNRSIGTFKRLRKKQPHHTKVKLKGLRYGAPTRAKTDGDRTPGAATRDHRTRGSQGKKFITSTERNWRRRQSERWLE